MDSGATSRRSVLASLAGGVSASSLGLAGGAGSATAASTSGVSTGTTYKILNADSGKALDVARASTDDGGDVHQWEYVAGTNQQWTVEAASDGYYALLNQHSGKALDVEGVSTDDGATVHQWTYVGGENQQWEIEPVGEGLYRLVARHSGKVAEAPQGALSNGDDVRQWGDGGGRNQRWALFAVGSPYDASVTPEPRDQWAERDNGSTGTVVLEVTNDESRAVVINPTVIGQFSGNEAVMNPDQSDVLLTAGETREISVTFERLDEASNIWIDVNGDGTNDDTLQQVPYTTFGD